MEENLNKEETYNFIRKAFENGSVETTGTDISRVLPPMSRFSKNNDRLSKKNNVIDKLVEFFNRFFNISDGNI